MYYVDVGNTFTKIYETKLILKKKTNSNIIFFLLDLASKEKIYIFSVVLFVSNELRNKKNIVLVENSSCNNFINMDAEYYKKIGIDRLVGCKGALTLNDSFILVDVGTAITVDIVLNKTYHSGLIIPGARKMKESLETSTSKIISLVDERNSNTSLQIDNGIKYCVSAMIEKLKFEFDVPVIITGGGASELFAENESIYDDLLYLGMKEWIGEING